MSLRKLAIAATALTAMAANTAYASIIDRPFFQVLGVVVVWGSDGSTSDPIVSDFILGTTAGGTDLIAGDVTAVITGSLDPVDTATGATALGDTASFDPITGELSGGVLTEGAAGTDGVLDISDSLTAFEIDGNTDIDGLISSHESSFYVASNTAFEIQASTTAAVTSGDFTSLSNDNIAWSIDVTQSGDDGLAFGSAAQVPHTTSGPVATILDLGDISTDPALPTTVYEGDRRTAASIGSLAAQSVRFDLTYDLDADTATTGVQGYDLSLGAGSIYSDVTYTVYSL